MKILFKNSYIKDKELLKEIYSYHCFKRPITVFFNILAGLVLLKTIIEWIVYGYLNYIVLFISLLYFIFQVIYYHDIIKIQIKADYELNKGLPLNVTTIVTDEFIKNTASNGAVNEITYENLKKGFQTKNLILFISKANLIYIFRKDTFKIGTKDEFISFMQSKGIKIN